MRGGSRNKVGLGALILGAHLGCSSIAYAQAAAVVPLPAPRPASPPAAVPLPAPGSQPPTTTTPASPPRSPINPFGRTVTIDVQVEEGPTAVGILPLTITVDGRLLVPVEELVSLLGDAITRENAQALRAKAQSDGSLPIEAAADHGVMLTYNASRVALQLQITQAGDRRTQLSLAPRQEYDVGDFVRPASVSAYATFRTSVDYVSKGQDTGLQQPIVDGLFAVRAAGVVIEDEHTADFNRLTDKITRLGTRAVYDVEPWNMRFMGGDTDIVTSGFQQGIGVLGLSVLRQYRTFEPQRNIRPRSLDSFTLNRASDVEIMVNGVPIKRVALAPGRYDLTDFPFVNGSNQVQVVAIDPTGRAEIASFSRFFDLELLAPGLSEFAVTAGVISEPGLSGPVYLFDEPIASGYYRRGLTNALTIGINAQADKRAQQVGFEATYAAPIATFGANVAVSNFAGHGVGAAVRVEAQRNNDRAEPGQLSNLALGAEFHTANFSSPGAFVFIGDALKFRLNANASLRLPRDQYLSFSAGYSTSRLAPPVYDAGVNYSFRLGRSVSFNAGASYVKTDTGRSGFGASLALSMRLGPRGFVSASFDSRDKRGIVNYSNAGSQRIGSISTNLQAQYEDQSMGLSGAVDLVTNRADLGLSHSVTYDINGSAITGSRTSLRTATSIAFADGAIAISRPIRDAFAIVKPHRTLEGQKLLLDPTPDGNIAVSDFLGAPVASDVGAYSARTVRVDAPDVPAGYNFDSGSFLLRAPYRAGYRLVIGSDYTVTALGVLLDGEGKPLALAVGKAKSLDDADAPEREIFTNSVGRFGAAGLKPGRWRVRINGDAGASYLIAIPSEATGLVQAGTLEPEK